MVVKHCGVPRRRGLLVILASYLVLCCSWTNAEPVVPESLLDELDWRFVGPWRGGRVNAVTGHPTDSMTFLAGFTGGGIWKTEDGGLNWRNVSDGYLSLGSIGAIDISNSQPSVVYVGTGEQALRGDVSHGDGVYKSIDGGETWINVGLVETRQIAELIIHPTNPDIVYVAALGHFAGPNEERGVFRTLDGGDTWERVLYVDENTGAVALALDESNPSRLIAGMWDVRRFPWGIRSAGPGSAIFRSFDDGESWEKLTGSNGLPGGIMERMDVSISQSDPNRVWALVSAEGGRGLYRSEDFGDSWQAVNDDAELTGRTYYFQKLMADPVDTDTVYVLNWSLLVSRDGGESFDKIETGHADHHAFWIDPSNNRRMIDGSDGGAQVSFNGGDSWSTLHNQPTGQFYTLTLDDQEPYNLYGSQQDWSSIILPSIARSADPRGYFDIDYSEAGRIAVSRDDTNVLYISDHHWLLRYDRRTDAIRYVGPRDETNYGVGTRDIKFRFNWTFPVVVSKHKRDWLYVGSQYLHRSKDGGESWEILGPDLTRADPDKLELTPAPGIDTSSNDRYWGPLTRDSNGDHWFSTLYTITESPLSGRVIWTGSDDGVVHVTRDGGRRWTDVTPPGLPEYALITSIEASPRDRESAYLTASAYKLDDYRVFVYRTNDTGKTWTRISTGTSDHDIARVVRVDPANPATLYLGTETGVYLSFDNGDSWLRPENNFPAVPVYDMQVKDGSLIVATHGRGFWSLDHLGVVNQISELERVDQPVLFAPAATIRRDGNWAESSNAGKAAIWYWLPVDADSARIKFVDFEGEVAAEVSADGSAGLNQFLWDFAYPNATVVPGVVTRGRTEVGPIGLPGDYAVELSVDGVVLDSELTLLPDPNVSASHVDLKLQFDFLSNLRDKIDELNRAVIALRAYSESIEAMTNPSADASRIHAELRLLEQTMVQPKARYRKDLHANPVQVNDKLYRLANFVAAAHDKPTVVQYQLKDEFSATADDVLARYYRLVDEEIQRYNERIESPSARISADKEDEEATDLTEGRMPRN